MGCRRGDESKGGLKGLLGGGVAEKVVAVLHTRGRGGRRGWCSKRGWEGEAGEDGLVVRKVQVSEGENGAGGEERQLIRLEENVICDSGANPRGGGPITCIGGGRGDGISAIEDAERKVIAEE